MTTARDPAQTAGRGRPPITTRDQVSAVALELFARHGFEQTTMDDIADALGVGRRTLFRYFPSKNDIVWGDFDWVLDRLRALLRETDPRASTMEALGRAVVASNSYGPAEVPELRIRMTLITSVPALQAHSMLRYSAWRRVVAEFVAERRGEPPDGLVPQVIAHAALSTAMAAFVCWVEGREPDHVAAIERGFHALATGFPDPPQG